MAAMEPLYRLINIEVSVLSKEEKIFLEAALFAHVCEELKEIFREQHKDFFRLMKFTEDMEDTMLEAYFVRLIIRDILSTEEYTLSGIALYTDTHEDIIEEFFSGQNTSPSALFLRRLIELHRTIRRTFYLAIMKKITSEYSPA